MKLRLLNAGHSCIAYLSALIGPSKLVDEAMAARHPLLPRRLPRPRGPARSCRRSRLRRRRVYIDELLERFANPAIGDQVATASASTARRSSPSSSCRPSAPSSRPAGRSSSAALALAGLVSVPAGPDGRRRRAPSIDVRRRSRVRPSNAMARAARPRSPPAAFLGLRARVRMPIWSPTSGSVAAFVDATRSATLGRLDGVVPSITADCSRNRGGALE